MSPKKLGSKSVSLGVAVLLSAAVVTPMAANASPANLNLEKSVSIAAATKKVTTYHTTANVNLRKGAGTNHKIITTVKKSSEIKYTGKKSGVWMQVTSGKSTGWMHSAYIKTTVKNVQETPASPQTTIETTYQTTTNVNLRKGAGTNNAVIKVVSKGAKVTSTGKKSGVWTRVKASGSTGWLHSSYIKEVIQPTTSAKPTPVKPETSVSSTHITTTGLNMRSSASAISKIVVELPKGVGVTKTGKTSGNWWQITSGPYTGWVNSSYLKVGSGKEMTGSTNTTPNKVTLHANAVNVEKKIRALYGKDISAVYGIRAGSVGHSSGVAIDAMIKNYKTKAGIAAGDKIAKYLTDNHASLKIDYLIWQDKIWLGPYTGWVPYSTSGKYGTQFAGNWNDTTKHLDHIHIEVKK